MIARLHLPLIEPEDVVQHLGHQEKHWKAGRSAYALTHIWAKENGLPESIRSIFQTDSIFRQAELIDGFLERQVDLGSAGRAKPIFSRSSVLKNASQLLRLKERPESRSARWFRSGSAVARRRKNVWKFCGRRLGYRSNKRDRCAISFCIALRQPFTKPSVIGQTWLG